MGVLRNKFSLFLLKNSKILVKEVGSLGGRNNDVIRREVRVFYRWYIINRCGINLIYVDYNVFNLFL